MTFPEEWDPCNRCGEVVSIWSAEWIGDDDDTMLCKKCHAEACPKCSAGHEEEVTS